MCWQFGWVSSQLLRRRTFWRVFHCFTYLSTCFSLFCIVLTWNFVLFCPPTTVICDNNFTGWEWKFWNARGNRLYCTARKKIPSYAVASPLIGAGAFLASYVLMLSNLSACHCSVPLIFLLEQLWEKNHVPKLLPLFHTALGLFSRPFLSMSNIIHAVH